MPLPQTEKLLATIHTLRSPGGCPWDRKQTLADAARYLLEEAGELLEAALADDGAHSAEELADLLYMVCFCREILGEAQPLSFEDVARLGWEKLVRRHPHVFGPGERARDHHDSQQRWDEVKAAERREQGRDPGRESILKELPASSSPLAQALGYQENAAAFGFDWPDDDGAWDKLHEEIEELRRAARAGDGEQVRRESGDLLFAAVNVTRRLGAVPDDALRLANQRFRSRFREVEASFGWSRERLRSASLATLERAWREAKASEGKAGGAP